MRIHLGMATSLCILLASTPGLAQGCGPTRLKVTESLTLAMPSAEVWALIGNFQDMSWDADTIATTGSGGNIPDQARRILVLKGGAVFGESLYKYDPNAMSYSYHIDTIDIARLPVQNVSATIEVVGEGGGTKSTIRWKSAFYRNLRPGEGEPDMADAKAVAAMKAYLRAALDGLKVKADSRT